MKSYKFMNEAGNVSVKVRNALKEMMTKEVQKVMESKGFATSISADGEVAVYIANDAKSGEPIYAFIGNTISMRDPAVKTAKSKTKTKKKDTADEPMVDLFESAAEDD